MSHIISKTAEEYVSIVNKYYQKCDKNLYVLVNGGFPSSYTLISCEEIKTNTIDCKIGFYNVNEASTKFRPVWFQDIASVNTGPNYIVCVSVNYKGIDYSIGLDSFHKLSKERYNSYSCAFNIKSSPFIELNHYEDELLDEVREYFKYKIDRKVSEQEIWTFFFHKLRNVERSMKLNSIRAIRENIDRSLSYIVFDHLLGTGSIANYHVSLTQFQQFSLKFDKQSMSLFVFGKYYEEKETYKGDTLSSWYYGVGIVFYHMSNVFLNNKMHLLSSLGVNDKSKDYYLINLDSEKRNIIKEHVNIYIYEDYHFL